ncbi:type II toxin-antitoxin system PemK/MazF family toxin [Mucisphaera calidilacus]|uniref:mRNA interferase n=1 Tax=Mucisphaera calidilacus TaxID=2527982 RepID=A0A518BVQ6_9BACT|nr:type II toxin-antitoxin system PemK/MazF family toxin [Mucisphaera calidilacus]QDU71059.1 mRNA interferase MazF9 [Mucisphaera calidilacus]
MKAGQGQVWRVNLDPTIGSEIRKTRPAVVVSPDELNAHLNTVVVVPLTSGRAYPFRIATKVQGKPGVAAVDQVRTIDKQRLVKRIKTLKAGELNPILDALVEMFSH